jgi:hypothetical protein
MPEETPWRDRVAKTIGVLALAGAAWIGYQALTGGKGKPSPAPALSGKTAVLSQAEESSGDPAGTGATAVTDAGTRAAEGAATQPAVSGEVSPAEAERRLKALPPKEQQRGYYSLAKSSFREKNDAGYALLLVNKALDYSFHPTIALLKAEILQDQEMFNLADTELDRIRPWLSRMNRANQAQYHWLAAQQQLSRGPHPTRAGRARARLELKRYLALKPDGAEDRLKQARKLLLSLK